MKRTLFWMPVSIVTFLIGISALYFSYSPDSGLSHCTLNFPSPQVINNHDCVASKTFPGRSLAIGKSPKKDFFLKGLEIRGEGLEAMNEWYGKHLKAMGERALWSDSNAGAERYRFLWLRSFRHPIAVRVERKASIATLAFKELNGAGGYEPGDLITTKTFVVNPEQWCTFIQKLEQANYWSQPLEEDDEPGHDGAQWILEGVRGGRYHVVDRWSPREGEFREACVYLLELAGIDPAKLSHESY